MRVTPAIPLVPLRLETMKLGAVALLALAAAVIAFDATTNPRSPFHRWWRVYERALDRRLRALFLPTPPATIALTQAMGLVGVGALSPIVGVRCAFVLAFLVMFSPLFHLWRLRRKRQRALEGQIEPFLLALTNALRVTPSIANALASVEPVLINPMRQELELVLKEVRVGSTIDRALLAMAARTHLDDLDAALSSILIGRQVGGNVTEILESTASALREMARLAAVLRSKTSSGRIQFLVLAAAPVVVVVGFEFASPGYFNPLLRSFIGGAILVTSATLWLVAIGVARKVLSASA